MKRVLTILTFYVVLSTFNLSAQEIAPVLGWDVIVTNYVPHNIELRRGETAILAPTFWTSTNAVLNLSAASSVVLCYRAPVPNAPYYVSTGSVYAATSGQVRVRWTVANETIHDMNDYEIVVASSSSMLVRAFGRLQLNRSINGGASATNNPNPTTWTFAGGDVTGRYPVLRIAPGMVGYAELESIISNRLAAAVTNPVAAAITQGQVDLWNSMSGGGTGLVTDVEVSGGLLTRTADAGIRTIGLSTAAVLQVAAGITNPLSDRVSIIDTGKVSIAQGVALTNLLRGDIADGLDFSVAPTVNGNPVSTNSGGAGAETDPVYTTGLTARVNAIVTSNGYITAESDPNFTAWTNFIDISIGNESVAQGSLDGAIAVGLGAKVYGDSIAIGNQAKVGNVSEPVSGSIQLGPCANGTLETNVFRVGEFRLMNIANGFIDTERIDQSPLLNVSNAISILRARTNSCPSEIVAPEIRAYPRGTLYGTNAIVTLSRSTSIGHAWFQVGYQTNALSPFVAIDGYHLASTTNADATFTNVSIPPQTRISINVTNLATVTSNFNSDIGFKEP